MGDLCRMFYGGEHPLHFTVLGTTLCEAWAAPAWEGRQGAEAALVQLFSSGNPTHCVPEHPLTPPPLGRPAVSVRVCVRGAGSRVQSRAVAPPPPLMQCVPPEVPIGLRT